MRLTWHGVVLWSRPGQKRDVWWVDIRQAQPSRRRYNALLLMASCPGQGSGIETTPRSWWCPTNTVHVWKHCCDHCAWNSNECVYCLGFGGELRDKLCQFFQLFETLSCDSTRVYSLFSMEGWALYHLPRWQKSERRLTAWNADWVFVERGRERNIATTLSAALGDKYREKSKWDKYY